MAFSTSSRKEWYNFCMTVSEIIQTEEVKSVIENYRSMCFWSFPDDFMPKNKRQLLLALDSLERYGDRVAYQKAGVIRQWL